MVQPLWKSAWSFLKKFKKKNYHMIQQSHFWVYIQRKGNHYPEETFLLLSHIWWFYVFSCQVESHSCDSLDCSLPGSSVHGILQTRIREWVAISFSRGSSPHRNQTQVSCTAGSFFTNWATREALMSYLYIHYRYICIFAFIFIIIYQGNYVISYNMDEPGGHYAK